MKVSDIQVGQISVVELKPADDESFGISLPLKVEVSLLWAEATDEVLLHVGDQVWTVVGADPRNDEILANLLERRSGRLSWLAGAFPKRGNASTLVVQVQLLATLQLEPLAWRTGYGSPQAVMSRILETVQTQFPLIRA